MLKQVVIALIRVYQFFSSRFLKKTCRFYPTCSQYTVEAINKYGLGPGLWRGIKRVCRCHPYNPGGIDLP